MQCTHSNQLADVGMLQMNKAEAKRYEEENITIMSMIISSSHSYIYYIFLKFYTIQGFSSAECFVHKIFQGAFKKEGESEREGEREKPIMTKKT